jgi:nucleoside-diphosphate-sugar epimerase
MRVLLAGASGTIGTSLIPLLQRAGHQVSGITRTPGALAGTGATEVVADLLDRDRLIEATGGSDFDAVVHLASGIGHPPRRYSDQRHANRLRSEGTSALIAVARRTSARRLVVASSTVGYGFGDFGATPVDESAAFGERRGGPVDRVFKSLLVNEQQARAFGGVALRFGLVYRARGPIAAVDSRWAGDLPFVHVEDAASAALAALDAPAGSIFNVVDDTPASWRDLQDARANLFESPDPARIPGWMLRRTAPFVHELLGRTSLRVSNERARDTLAWVPTFPSYREGIAAAATGAISPSVAKARATAPVERRL